MAMRAARRRLSAAAAAAALMAGTVVLTGDPASAAGTVTVTDVASITEAGAQVFTVNRTDATNAEAIDYTLTFSGGADGTDASVTAEGDGVVDGTLNFGAGIADQTLTITASQDTVCETGEGYILTLTNSDDGSSLPAAETGDLIDDGGGPGSIEFVLTSTAVTETDANQTVSPVVRRTGGNECQVSVTLADAGSADINPQSGTVTFPAGAALPQDVTADTTVVGDDIIEPLEGPLLTISSPTNGATLGGQITHSVSITDDDGAVNFSTTAVADTEDDNATGNTVGLTVSRAGTGEASTVTISSSSTGDVSGTTVVFGTGDTSGTATVTVVGDDVDEAFEAITLTIDSATGNSFVGGTNTATVNVTDDDATPAGSVDAYTVAEDGTLDTSVANPSLLDNDTDADSGNGPGNLDVGSNTNPTNGTLDSLNTSTGHFVYSPDSNFEGSDSFTYQVTDGTNTSGSVTVNITVTADNDAPTAVNDNYNVDEDTTLNVGVGSGVRSNDSDIEDAQGSLTVAVNSDVSSGTLTLNANGSFTYVPFENFDGGDSFTYTLTDTGGETDTATVNITVNDVNADPVAVDDTFFDVARNATSAFLPLTEGTNDSDQDGDSLDITGFSATSAEGGTVSCTIVICQYTPPDDYAGEDSFTYTISDGNGGSDTGTVTVFVGMPRDCDQTGSNLTGTAGDDVLCGTNGADTIDGGGGDDVILGFGGNDTLTGGDGADLIHGGDGTDNVTYDATPGSDTLVASEGDLGEDVIAAIEQVFLNALGGGDSVSVVPSATTEFTIDGGDGFDGLTYQKTNIDNVSDSGTVISGDGVQDVNYQDFETVVTDGLLFIGTSGGDQFEFINAPEGGLRIDLLDGGDTIEVDFGDLAGPVEVDDSGTSGDDQLTVNSGGGSDTVELVRDRIRLGSERIDFANMERLEVNGGSGNDTFNVDFSTGAVLPAATPLPEFVLVLGGPGTDLLVLTYDQDCAIDRSSDPVTITLDDGGVISLDPSLEGADVTCNGQRRVVSSASGYWMARASGGISAFGEIQDHGGVSPTSSPVSAMVNHPANIGLWVAEQDGTVYTRGRTTHYGDPDDLNLNASIVGISSSRTGEGYYLLGSDGGVFAYGDAAFHGSTGNLVLNQPVVSMAANPEGEGYWFVASDGGIFTFGPDTAFHGSIPQVLPPGVSLSRPIVGMAPTASGNGYWLVAADGGVFAFGDAQFHGSVPGVLPPGVLPNQPMVGIVVSPTGNGYWIVAADGGVFAFGDAEFYGSLGGAGITDLVAFAG